MFNAESVDKEISKSNDRLNKMSTEEKRELYEHGLKIAYPNGYWRCEHNTNVFIVENGRICDVCGRGKPWLKEILADAKTLFSKLPEWMKTLSSNSPKKPN